MPTQYKIDLIDGDQMQQTTDGIELHRIAVVYGVGGSKSARCMAAMTAAGVPQMNELHPDMPFLRVTARNARAEGLQAGPTSIIKIDITYTAKLTPRGGDSTQPEQPTYEIGTVIQQVKTEVDRAGNPIVVGPGDATDQGSSVSVTDAQTTVRVTRTEEGIDPKAISEAFSNKLNSRPWQGDAAGLWLCRGIHSSSSDNGESWKVTYDFQKRPARPSVGNPWNPVASYIDPHTGKVRAGASFSNGDLKEVEWYGSADFNVLGI